MPTNVEEDEQIHKPSRALVETVDDLVGNSKGCAE